MESKIQKTNSSSFAMEIVMNAPAMQSIPNHKRKGGT